MNRIGVCRSACPLLLGVGDGETEAPRVYRDGFDVKLFWLTELSKYALKALRGDLQSKRTMAARQLAELPGKPQMRNWFLG
jgi:hypothetical protein